MCSTVYNIHCRPEIRWNFVPSHYDKGLILISFNILLHCLAKVYIICQKLKDVYLINFRATIKAQTENVIE
jgi:hypothetical protein